MCSYGGCSTFRNWLKTPGPKSPTHATISSLAPLPDGRSPSSAKGRITAPENLAALVAERGFTHLPLTFHHAEQAGSLPMHHRDPFDRFLIAQAQAEGLVLVTRDARIPLYGVRTLAA